MLSEYFSSELIGRKHLPYSSFSTCNLQRAALYNCIPIYGTKSRFTKTHREVVSTGQLKGFNSHHVIKVSIRACPLSNVFFKRITRKITHYSVLKNTSSILQFHKYTHQLLPLAEIKDSDFYLPLLNLRLSKKQFFLAKTLIGSLQRKSVT